MVIKWILTWLAVLIAGAILTVAGAKAVNYFHNHITAENGIDEGIYVDLGGQEQYLLIRGENTDNPVMIWLHGGPSSPEGFANYYFQKYLVDDYTVINWDQRGCGRTYYRNIKNDPENKTVTFEQAKADLNDLVDYACRRFDKEKVIIVGHSYGTLLGSSYVLSNPERVAAFVGVGQVVTIESDIYSYEDALKKASAKGDDTTKMVEAYNKYVNDSSLLNMMELRKYTAPYHKAEKSANTIWTGIASPYMGIDDIRWFLKQMGSLEEYIQLNQQLFDYILSVDVRDYGMEYSVPVGFISGSQDWTTPAKYAQDYYDDITAPEKRIALIEGCGHLPQYDDPAVFCEELKGMLNEFLN